MNNPMEQYQYEYGSGLINPYSMLVSTVSRDYYTICRVVSSDAFVAEAPDVLTLGPSEGLILSSTNKRVCVHVEGRPSVSLVFDRPFESMGVNEHGAYEYRWYWDEDHPDSFIGVQLLQEGERGDILCYCIVIDVCNASPLLKGGSFTVTATTGLESASFEVAIQQTWMF